MDPHRQIIRNSKWPWAFLGPVMGFNLYAAYGQDRWLTLAAVVLTMAYALGGMMFGVFVYRTLARSRSTQSFR